VARLGILGGWQQTLRSVGAPWQADRVPWPAPRGSGTGGGTISPERSLRANTTSSAPDMQCSEDTTMLNVQQYSSMLKGI